MSNLIYASINGKRQGLISAGCSSLDSIGNRCQAGHENQVQVLTIKYTKYNIKGTTNIMNPDFQE
jgi:type VI secretion system Hcp family effector